MRHTWPFLPRHWICRLSLKKWIKELLQLRVSSKLLQLRQSHINRFGIHKVWVKIT